MSHGLKHLARLDLTPKGIIHVGASAGQEVEKYLDFKMRPVVFFEALEEPFARLKRKIGSTRDYFPVQACLSDVSGRKVQFNVASNGGQASSYLAPAAHKDIYPDITFDSVVEMTTTTLDDQMRAVFERTHYGPADFDYLAIDVQGAERDVLNGAGDTLKSIKSIWTEVNFVGLYANDVSFYDLIDHLRTLGFDLYFVSMRKQGWGDALFVRKDALKA